MHSTSLAVAARSDRSNMRLTPTYMHSVTPCKTLQGSTIRRGAVSVERLVNRPAAPYNANVRQQQPGGGHGVAVRDARK